jgi:ribosomal protein L11 methyltransferase
VIDRTLWPGAWRRVVWTLPARLEEEASALALGEGGCGATTRPGPRGTIRLEAWFESEEAAREAIARLLAAPWGSAPTRGPEVVRDEGWLAASLAPRPAIEAGAFLVTDERSPAGGAAGRRHVLRLPPGRAFGTGEHATTKLCLELLDPALAAGARVLDLGTGSGILAIAAALAGARQVLALDGDPRVVGVARENAELNGLSGGIAIAAGSWQALAQDARIDGVLANVHRSALVKGARALAAHLPAGGWLIASGFAADDRQRVAEAYAARGLVETEGRVEQGWCALLLERPARRKVAQ